MLEHQELYSGVSFSHIRATFVTYLNGVEGTALGFDGLVFGPV